MKLFQVFDTVSYIEASDFHEFDIPKHDAGVICITQSGETADILQAGRLIKNLKIPLIGITNVIGSLVTTLCDFGVF